MNRPSSLVGITAATMLGAAAIAYGGTAPPPALLAANSAQQSGYTSERHPATGTANSSHMGSTHHMASAKTSRSARSFAEKANQANLLEVEAGKLAEQRAENDQVKSFGQQMVQDHSNADSKLKSIAQAQNIELSDKLDAKHEAKLAKLRAEQGAAFDKTYTRMMLKDHRQDIREFERASKNVENPQMRSFAEQTLPTLREHLASAEKLPDASGHEAVKR